MSYRNKRLRPGLYNYTVTADTLTTAALDPCFYRENFAYLPTDSIVVEKTSDFIVKAIYQWASKSLGRPIFTKTYKAYADYFPHDMFTIKTPDFISLTSFQYYDSGSLVDVPANSYYTGKERDYAYIDTVDQEYWPHTYDKRKAAIEVVYTAGYGSTESAIPEDLRTAVYMTATKLLENRGDCMDLTATNEGLRFSIQAAVPHQAKLLFQPYKVLKSNRAHAYAPVTNNISLYRGDVF